MSAILPALSITAYNASTATKTVTIDGTVYRNGFCEDLYPLSINCQDDCYSVNGKEFYRVDCEQFDLIYTPTGGPAFDVLYCAEEQWDQAKSYYEDGDNFLYYCEYMEQPDMDISKFEALMEFIKENKYGLFGSNSDVEVCRLPMPDWSSQITFHKESKDGMLISSQGNKLYLIEGKLYSALYYDMGNGNNEELVAAKVPEEIGQYFINLLEQIQD